MLHQSSLITAKILSLSLQNRATLFYSNAFFTKHLTDDVIRDLEEDKNIVFLQKFLPREYQALLALNAVVLNLHKTAVFSLTDPGQPSLKTSFTKPRTPLTNTGYLIASTPLRTILNRQHYVGKTYQNFSLLPLRDLQNHLIFIDSSLGQYYYFGDSKHISLYNLEKDYYYKDQTASWVGRYLLLQVIKPSKKIRLALSLSTSLNHDQANLLPHAMLIGTQRFPLPFIGRGSARIFSPLFTPRKIDNADYFMIDMAKEGIHFPLPTHGLMKIFGENLLVDHRQLIAMARDISLISDEDYQQQKPPASIHEFPSDLANPQLEYSGIYEDGWISEAAFVRLMLPTEKSQLLIQGFVPLLATTSFNAALSIYLNGKKMTTSLLKVGNFKLRIPLHHAPGMQKIELHFSNKQILPVGDARPVAAKIEFIGFV
jgi:hypothetical protein